MHAEQYSVGPSRAGGTHPQRNSAIRSEGFVIRLNGDQSRCPDVWQNMRMTHQPGIHVILQLIGGPFSLDRPIVTN